jgi:hypothetical protein
MANHRLPPNKSLKDAASRLDSFSQRMLRILCAAFRCPLALRYVLPIKLEAHERQLS